MLKHVLVGAGAAAVVVSLSVPGGARAEEDKVLAKVNGAEITASDVEAARKLLPREYQGAPDHFLVSSLVREYLMAEQARKEKLHENDAFKKELKRIARQLLQRSLFSSIVEKEVTDEALKARYEQFTAENGGREEVHARHILLKTKEEAEEVIKALDGGGDFIELAKTKSTGPSGPNGGDLNYFGRGQMVPPFEKAAFEMEKGAYSKTPVQTDFGFHVIRVEDKRTAPPPSFEEVGEQLRGQLTQEALAKYVDNLRNQADVERFDNPPAKAQ